VEELERLGDGSAAPGYLLLGLLSLHDWWIGVTHAAAGGICVSASHPVFGRVERYGSSVAAIAPDLVQECAAMSARGPLQ